MLDGCRTKRAVIRIGRKALKNEVMWVLAAALAFVTIYFFKVPFPCN